MCHKIADNHMDMMEEWLTAEGEKMASYDMERFVPAPDPELICPICHCVLHEPHETTCRHVFCKVCIVTWLLKPRDLFPGNYCPTCREYTMSIKPALPLLCNLIDKLTMHCANHEQGCDVIVAKERLEAHERDCGFSQVHCRHAGCELELLKKDQEDHEQQCCHRLVHCTHGCNLLMPFRQVDQHNCLQELRRGNLEKDMEVSVLRELVVALIRREGPCLPTRLMGRPRRPYPILEELRKKIHRLSQSLDSDKAAEMIWKSENDMVKPTMLTSLKKIAFGSEPGTEEYQRDTLKVSRRILRILGVFRYAEEGAVHTDEEEEDDFVTAFLDGFMGDSDSEEAPSRDLDSYHELDSNSDVPPDLEEDDETPDSPDSATLSGEGLRSSTSRWRHSQESSPSSRDESPLQSDHGSDDEERASSDEEANSDRPSVVSDEDFPSTRGNHIASSPSLHESNYSPSSHGDIDSPSSHGSNYSPSSHGNTDLPSSHASNYSPSSHGSPSRLLSSEGSLVGSERSEGHSPYGEENDSYCSPSLGSVSHAASSVEIDSHGDSSQEDGLDWPSASDVSSPYMASENSASAAASPILAGGYQIVLSSDDSQDGSDDILQRTPSVSSSSSSSPSSSPERSHSVPTYHGVYGPVSSSSSPDTPSQRSSGSNRLDRMDQEEEDSDDDSDNIDNDKDIVDDDDDNHNDDDDDDDNDNDDSDNNDDDDNNDNDNDDNHIAAGPCTALDTSDGPDCITIDDDIVYHSHGSDEGIDSQCDDHKHPTLDAGASDENSSGGSSVSHSNQDSGLGLALGTSGTPVKRKSFLKKEFPKTKSRQIGLEQSPVCSSSEEEQGRCSGGDVDSQASEVGAVSDEEAADSSGQEAQHLEAHHKKDYQAKQPDFDELSESHFSPKFSESETETLPVSARHQQPRLSDSKEVSQSRHRTGFPSRTRGFKRKASSPPSKRPRPKVRRRRRKSLQMHLLLDKPRLKRKYHTVDSDDD